MRGLSPPPPLFKVEGLEPPCSPYFSAYDQYCRVDHHCLLSVIFYEHSAYRIAGNLRGVQFSWFSWMNA